MAIDVKTVTCPDCGLRLCEEPWIGGLCPRCLLGLALGEGVAERGHSLSGKNRPRAGRSTSNPLPTERRLRDSG
jgi:hypothetical protein